MDKKEYLRIINALIKLATTQAEAIERMNRVQYNTDRHLSSLTSRIGRLEGIKEKEL